LDQGIPQRNLSSLSIVEISSDIHSILFVQGFISFGAGSRTRVGKNISVMEMQQIVLQLL